MNTRRIVAAAPLLAAVVVAVAPGPVSAQPKPGITCAYAEAGPPGPAGNRLDIRVKLPEETVALRVAANGRIRVSDDRRIKRLRCAGGGPTVTNVDRIAYKAPPRAENTNLAVVTPEAFGPGTTPREQGGDGIEITATGRSISFGAIGTESRDVITAGESEGATLIEFGAEPEGGADATIRAKNITLLAQLNGGDDEFLGDGGALFPSPMLKASVSAYGGEGADRITGGRYTDYLDGGPGVDELRGSGGPDILSGGPGSDLLDGGNGRDELDAIDRRMDSVVCGPGTDHADLDLIDNDLGCETFGYP